MKKHHYPIFATAYYRPPSPPLEEWAEDFANIKEMGFDAIQAWIYWGWCERSPGKFNFSEFDRFFDLADRNALMIIPQMILEMPPSWLDVKHPLQTPEGVLRKSHFPSMYIPCFDDPDIRKQAEPFIRTLVERYKDRNIHHWPAWNEHRSRWDCTCPESQKAYAKWLEKKYETIDKYNEKFGKCFHDFSAVAKYISTADYSDEYNWRLWAADSLAWKVKWVADIIKEIDPLHPTMSHAGITSTVQNVRKDTCVDALIAEVVDIYSSSCDASWESQAYVANSDNVKGMSQNNLSRVQMQLDWLRSLSSDSWVAELYGDHFSPWTTREPKTLLWQFWQAVANNLGGIKIWEYKVERIGIETLGYGLVGLDGKPNERSKALASAISLIKGQLSEFFADYTIQEPTVGILYDERSHLLSDLESGGWFGRIGGEYACCGGIYSRALSGIYEALRRKNTVVKWIPHQRLDRAVGELDAIMVAGHGMMDEQLAEQLKGYVNSGGTLFAQAGTGWRKDNTWGTAIIPSYGLDELFGIREKSRGRVDGTTQLRNQAGDDIDQIATFATKLEVVGAKAKAYFNDGTPALTCNESGKGRAWYLGGFLGMDCADNGHVLNMVLGEPGDVFLNECSQAGLDVIPWRKRYANESRMAHFVFNTQGHEQTCLMPDGIDRCVSLFGTITREESSITFAANSAILIW